MLATESIRADNRQMPSRSPSQGRLGRALIALFAAAAVVPLASCLSWLKPRPDFTWDKRPSGVSFATTPPGADVIIDGMPSGYATPCIVALDEDETYRIEFELEGYRTAGLFLSPNRRWFLVPYKESSRAPRVWNFPLWLPLGAFLMPIRTNTALAPSRIHLRLRLGTDNKQAPASAASAGLPSA